MLLRAVTVLLTALLVAGCGDDPIPEPIPLAPLTPTTTVIPEFDDRLEPAEAVLGMVPSSATTLTVTDFDQARIQVGLPDLTSQDLMSDRSEFWRRAEAEAVLLTDGLLRQDNSVLMLDYGFTQDDVDWEARFTGPDGNGFVLALRPDLDLAGVRRAVDDGVGPLAGATLRAQDHLLVSGTAEDGDQVWANEPIFEGLFDLPAVSTYGHRGCLPVNEALGPDVTQEDLEELERNLPVRVLDDLAAFSIGFGDHLATVRFDLERSDVFNRLAFGRDWPDPEFGRGFQNGVGDPTTGRIGYDVPNPPKAAAVTLLEELPFAICNELEPIPEPTGL